MRNTYEPHVGIGAIATTASILDAKHSLHNRTNVRQMDFATSASLL